MRQLLIAFMLVLCFGRIVCAQQATGRDADAGAARGTLRAALSRLEGVVTSRPQTDEDAKSLNKEIRDALAKHPAAENDAELTALDAAIQRWADRAAKLPHHGPLFEAITDVNQANKEYQAALKNRSNDSPGSSSAVPQTGSNANSQSTNSLAAGDETDAKNQSPAQAGLLSLVLPFGMIATPLLALGLFAVAFVSINKTRREVDDARTWARQSVSGLKGKQENFAKQLDGLTASNGDLFARLAELSAELGALGMQVQRVQGASSAAAAQPLMPVIVGGDGAAARVPEPPAFPVAADAYLRKMQRHATVVKPDFQNGILVADSENKGELVLVQDAGIAPDVLFIIPRATQFQMKQDFYTYYERYYDCERPASGAVWILDPAVVERVPGGWVLREKGVLEVR